MGLSRGSYSGRCFRILFEFYALNQKAICFLSRYWD
jgi:hypothetical protein